MKARFHIRLSFLSAACLAATLASASHAASIGKGLQQAMKSGSDVSFIARFNNQFESDAFPGKGNGKGVQLAQMLRALREQADFSQADAVKLLKGRGAKRLVQLWSINALAGTASPEAIDALSKLPGVTTITLDSTLAAPSPEPAAASAPEWNLDSIRAPELWGTGIDGSGTVVASMDTGVDVQHPDLEASYRGGANSWFDPNNEHATPYDASGHGTQTTGLIVGGDAGGTFIGVAPGAQWIAAKIFNDSGVATLSGIHQGFQWMLDPDDNPATNDSPDVVNNSWGFPDLAGTCYTEFEQDINVLRTSGIAVVFSAGNQGSLGSVSPGDNADSFAVGAVDSSLTVAATSSRGPSACDNSFFPEVVAPGVGVRTSDLTFGGVFPDSYISATGTSFAAPHVSGMMALLRQAHPGIGVAELEQVIKDSAVDLGSGGVDNAYGYGLIDAVAANDLLSGSPPGPTCTDSDNDSFFAESGCGTSLDCNDADADINPDACDIKRDGIDQDCDGSDRTRGKSCPVSDGGSDEEPIFGVEGKGKTCSDGIDNDLDGALDCSDSDCSKNKSCR
jgi:bacillopeptidase F